jgi:hypothetical protein
MTLSPTSSPHVNDLSGSTALGSAGARGGPRLTFAFASVAGGQPPLTRELFEQLRPQEAYPAGLEVLVQGFVV